MAEIRITGVDELKAKLKRVQDVRKVLRPPMQASLDLVRKDAQDQPDKAPGAFSALATAGQRRAYWAKVRRNPSIHGPGGYRRSGTLKRGWTKRVESLPNGLIGHVENAVGYAQYVHGDLRQQPFHKVSGFPKERKLLERRRREIERLFAQAIDRELAK